MIRNRLRDDRYVKAKDRHVIVTTVSDPSPEGQLRVRQAREIICQLIVLSKKKGRPSKQEEVLDEAA